MSTALMIEIFGYIGCIFVIISMLMTSVVKLRVINTVGSSISAVYAMIGHSYPLAVVNASLVVINIYNLIKLSKADGNHYDTIRGNKEDSYLTYFIKHYKEDMKKYLGAFSSRYNIYSLLRGGSSRSISGKERRRCVRDQL